MDELLPKLLTFPPHPPPQNPLSDGNYEDGIKAQISAVRKISEKNLLHQTSGGESPLNVSWSEPSFEWHRLTVKFQVINLALNTVPYAFILIAHINALQKGSKVIKLEALWEKISGFLESFDARQVRYLGPEFMTIIDAAATFARQAGQVSLGARRP